MDNVEKQVKNIQKGFKNEHKLFSRILKYLKKIEKFEQYDDYIKNLKITLIDWLIELQVRAILLFLLFKCLAGILFLITPNVIMLAEGTSLLWFLLVELKQDLWRKG